MSHHTAEKTNHSDGYSLTEMVLVLACAAVLLVAAVPGIVTLRNEWTLLGATRILEASLQWGRMHAIASNTPLMFDVDGDQQSFRWLEAASGAVYANSERRLQEGVRITASPRRPLRFYPHGNAAPAGTYTLAGNAGSYSVIVAPGGRIRTQRDE